MAIVQSGLEILYVGSKSHKRQVNAIWDQVPPHLRAIVGKRVIGMRLTKAEQGALNRYRPRLAGMNSRGRPLVTELAIPQEAAYVHAA